MNELEKIYQIYKSSDRESKLLAVSLLRKYCHNMKLYPTKYYYALQTLDIHFKNVKIWRLYNVVDNIFKDLLKGNYSKFYKHVSYQLLK